MFSYEGSEKGQHAGIKPEKGLSAAANTNNRRQVTKTRQRKEKRDHRDAERERQEQNGRAETTETMQRRFTVEEGSEQMWRCISYPLLLPLSH